MFQVNDLIQIKQGSPLRDILDFPDKKYRVIMVMEKHSPESALEYVITPPDAQFDDISQRHRFQGWYVHEQFEVCGRYAPALHREVSNGKE